MSVTINGTLGINSPDYTGGVPVTGQCRLAKSGANLVLSPFNGNKLVINGVAYAIPAAGVSLAAPATSGTTYYIYAYMSGATMTLEASATGHSTDSTTGVEIKTGDSSRSLVGMARTVSSAWVDSAAQRFVLSWFNRNLVVATNALGATAATASGSFVELSSSYRAEFLCWATPFSISGSAAATSGLASNSSAYYGVGIDGVSIPTGALNQTSVWNSGIPVSFSCEGGSLQAEGYHYGTMCGATNGAVTFTYQASYTSVSVVLEG